MPTRSAIGFSVLSDEEAAAKEIASQIAKYFPDTVPDALIIFASSRYEYQKLLRSLNASCKPRLLIGCSSAGEFVGGKKGEGAISAMALASDEIVFNLIRGKGLSKHRIEIAQQMANGLVGLKRTEFKHKTVLLLADALAGYTDDVIDNLNSLTGGAYQFFGGGAGDDAKFSKTHVFCGTEAFTDGIVGLEILSHKPLGIGVQHGWEPVGDPMRVTEAEGMILKSLNAIPAVEAFAEHASKTGQKFMTDEPIPFFLHNTLGIQTKGGYKLRVPLAIQEDGSILCASNIPTGATVTFMKASLASSVEAANTAVGSALEQIKGHAPGAALFFDCVATRLRMGAEFGEELSALEEALGPVNVAGCNTYGQIARVNGQFNGFHNCTAVVCVFPE